MSKSHLDRRQQKLSFFFERCAHLTDGREVKKHTHLVLQRVQRAPTSKSSLCLDDRASANMDLSAEEMGAGTAAGGGRLPAANGAVGGDSGEKLQPVRQLLLDSLTYRIQIRRRNLVQRLDFELFSLFQA